LAESGGESQNLADSNPDNSDNPDVQDER